MIWPVTDDFEVGTLGPTLVSIAVTPANQIIRIADTIVYTAIGTYDDSSTQNLTNSVTWAYTVHVGDFVDVSTFMGVSAGTTVISATLGSISGNTGLTVSGASLIRNPRLRFFDSSGKPLIGGLLYLCTPGSPSIAYPEASWQDYEKKILNPNPIVLDSAGYASPIFSDSFYKAFLYSSGGALISSLDGIWSETLGLFQLVEAQLQFWDKNGNPLVGGKLYTCVPGAATINQTKASYSDLLLTTLNANPIILNAEGKASLIYSVTYFYKLFLFDSNDVPVLSQDNVGPSGPTPVPF